MLKTVIVIHDTGTMIRSNKFKSPIQILIESVQRVLYTLKISDHFFQHRLLNIRRNDS